MRRAGWFVLWAVAFAQASWYAAVDGLGVSWLVALMALGICGVQITRRGPR